MSLSFWSFPYHIGESYEKSLSYEDWQDLLFSVIRVHFSIIKPDGFLAIDIADIAGNITRGALDRLGTSIIPVRLVEKIDFKGARHIFRN